MRAKAHAKKKTKPAKKKEKETAADETRDGEEKNENTVVEPQQVDAATAASARRSQASIYLVPAAAASAAPQALPLVPRPPVMPWGIPHHFNQNENTVVEPHQVDAATAATARRSQASMLLVPVAATVAAPQALPLVPRPPVMPWGIPNQFNPHTYFYGGFNPFNRNNNYNNDGR